MKSFWQSRSARVLTVVLFAQAAFFYGFSRPEKVQPHKQLSQFTLDNSPWKLVQEVEMDKESLEVLRADDILSRAYVNPKTGENATLFVAYFSTQRTGKTPHSPKNCLPGSGWVPSMSGVRTITVPGWPEPIRVNQYVIARGQNQSAVLYWYQSRNRVVASEYSAKLYTVTDSVRYNRSDTSLVRVVVPIEDGNTERGLQTATSFVQNFFAPLKEYLPS